MPMRIDSTQWLRSVERERNRRKKNKSLSNLNQFSIDNDSTLNKKNQFMNIKFRWSIFSSLFRICFPFYCDWHEFLLIFFFDHFDGNRSVWLFLERELLMYISNKNCLFMYIRGKMIAHETVRRRAKKQKQKTRNKLDKENGQQIHKIKT